MRFVCRVQQESDVALVAYLGTLTKTLASTADFLGKFHVVQRAAQSARERFPRSESSGLGPARPAQGATPLQHEGAARNLFGLDDLGGLAARASTPPSSAVTASAARHSSGGPKSKRPQH